MTMQKISIGLLLFLLFTLKAEGQTKGLMNTTESPFSLMQSTDLEATRFTGGFWKERFDVCQHTMVPFMWDIFNDAERSHSFRNFEIAAGLYEGEHDGPPFHDGDFYKWLEGAISVYAINKDPELNQLIDQVISVMQRAQREDGYIHTPVNIAERNRPEEAVAFAERLDFETYNLGHLMTAACLHHRVTGKETLLNMAIKAADFLLHFYETASADLARNAICPSHYMGVTEIYRTTRDPRYLELAKNLIDIRGLVTNGRDHNQDRIPFRQQTTAMGHAVRANYLYAGVADVALETGDSTLLKPLDLIWKDLVQSKVYITGGCGALYDGVSPDGTTYDQPSIQLIHQSYGRPYQLPNLTAHNESCANIGKLLWNWRMLQLTADTKYAHWLEQTLYNSILSAVSLDGKRYFYTNPLAVNNDLPYELRWSKDREEYISHCNCCPPNVVRTVAQVNNYIYSLSENTLWCHLFSDSQLKTELPEGGRIELRQKTDYPWDGKVVFEIADAPASNYSIKLRIPDWADDASISINNKGTKPVQAGSYATLTRKWKKGDLVTLEMPMKTRLIQAHHLVEETRNQVAVQRGPLVYCLESPDMPEGQRIFDFALSARSTFTPIPMQMEGSKIMALEVDALLINTEEENALYRELKSPGDWPKQKIRLIPYYAWNNRGPSEMSIWIPLR